MAKCNKMTRRRVLRGIVGGTAVTVGLPLLECMLSPNGETLAATDVRLPICFGTWFWGLGLIPGHWEPGEIGSKYELLPHLAVLEPIKSKINLFSGMQVFLDGKVNQNHYSGAQCQMTGVVSKTGSEYSTSIDTMVGDHVGGRTRFRSLVVACDGNRRSTWSARGSNGMNPAEISPLALYGRIFGADFQDPNSATFKPDPTVMVRHSVLSGVTEQRRDLLNKVSAPDRARLDEFFSSVRDLEQQLALQLERPATMPACSKPPDVGAETIGDFVDQTRHTHRQFATLITHALACGQTQIFNVSVGSSFSPMRIRGEETGYHQLTHEEPIDAQLGYQPKCKWLAEQQLDFLRELVQMLDSVREGDATLLDRTLVLAITDHGEARLHSMKKYPVITAGSGGGRMRTGFHLAAEGDAATRVGLTVLQALRVPGSGSWGTESNHVTKVFSELLI